MNGCRTRQEKNLSQHMLVVNLSFCLHPETMVNEFKGDTLINLVEESLRQVSILMLHTYCQVLSAMNECVEKPEPYPKQKVEKINILKTFRLFKRAHIKLEIRKELLLKIFSPLKRSSTIRIGQY